VRFFCQNNNRINSQKKGGGASDHGVGSPVIIRYKAAKHDETFHYNNTYDDEYMSQQACLGLPYISIHRCRSFNWIASKYISIASLASNGALMYAYKILPATGIRLSGNVTRRTTNRSLHKPGTILGVTIRRSSHRPFCRMVATNNLTWTRVCVTFNMTMVKQRLSNNTANTANTHAHQWALPPNQSAWSSKVKMNNNSVVIKASSMPSTKTQQTLPHKDGVKSKCKKPAIGKELAGAEPTILGIGNAVVVGVADVVSDEDAGAAVATAVAVL
jgi:hypothetical protein